MNDELKDLLTVIYSTLIKNEEIAKMTLDENGQHRIKYYDYPETANHNQVFLIIDPVGTPVPVLGGSDKDLQLEFTVQISIESKVRAEVKKLQKLVYTSLKELHCNQLPGGLDQYFDDTKRYVDARRYQGTTDLYDTNY